MNVDLFGSMKPQHFAGDHHGLRIVRNDPHDDVAGRKRAMIKIGPFLWKSQRGEVGSALPNSRAKRGAAKGAGEDPDPKKGSEAGY